MEEQIAALTKKLEDFENKIVLMANIINEQKESIKRLEEVVIKHKNEKNQLIDFVNELSWKSIDTVKKRHKRGLPTRGFKLYWAFQSKTQEEYRLRNRYVKKLFLK